MPNGTYGGVRGKETKIGREKKKNLRFPTYSILYYLFSDVYQVVKKIAILL